MGFSTVFGQVIRACSHNSHAIQDLKIKRSAGQDRHALVNRTARSLELRVVVSLKRVKVSGTKGSCQRCGIKLKNGVVAQPGTALEERMAMVEMSIKNCFSRTFGATGLIRFDLF